MELVFIWLLFGIFSALLASYKNRNAIGWFFVGLIFGPFGLLVAAFPKIDGPGQKTPQAETDMIRLIKNGKSAANIGSYLDIHTKTVMDEAQQLALDGKISYAELNQLKSNTYQPDTKVCPFCKESVKAEATICKHCRSQL